MTVEEFEIEPPDRWDEENARLWNAEAERRNAAWSVSDSTRSSDEVFREARKRLL